MYKRAILSLWNMNTCISTCTWFTHCTNSCRPLGRDSIFIPTFECCFLNFNEYIVLVKCSMIHARSRARGQCLIRTNVCRRCGHWICACMRALLLARHWPNLLYITRVQNWSTHVQSKWISICYRNFWVQTNVVGQRSRTHDDIPVYL